jgi:hypothetical protein
MLARSAAFDDIANALGERAKLRLHLFRFDMCFFAGTAFGCSPHGSLIEAARGELCAKQATARSLQVVLAKHIRGPSAGTGAGVAIAITRAAEKSITTPPLANRAAIRCRD